MNEHTRPSEPTNPAPGILGRLLRKLTLSPVSFGVEIDQRELDRFLMEPESR